MVPNADDRRGSVGLLLAILRGGAAGGGRVSEDSPPKGGGDIFDLAAAGLVVAGLWSAGRSISSFRDARTQRNGRIEAARLFESGRALENSGRTREAVAAYSSSLAKDPQNGDSANALAWIFATNATEQSHLDHSLILVNRALTGRPDGPTRAAYLDTRGEVYLRKRDYIRAIADFESCLALLDRPTDHPGPSALFRLGVAYVGLNQKYKAQDALRLAVQIDPRNVDARVYLARLAREFSDFDESVRHLTVACEVFQQNRTNAAGNDLLESMMLNELGYTYRLAGRDPEAAAVFRAAVAACDRNPYPYAGLGLIAGNSNDLQAMQRHLNTAIGKAKAAGDGLFSHSLLEEALRSNHPELILELLHSAGEITSEIYRRQRAAVGRRVQSPAFTTVNLSMDGGFFSMGDSYSVSGGQIGAMGKGAVNHGPMQQLVLPQGTDIRQLALELAKLKGELVTRASTAEEYHSVAEIESATRSLDLSDESGVVSHLRKAGKWAVETAAKIGVPVAEAALRSAMGL